MQSFINKIPSFINRNPDKQPKDILSKIKTSTNSGDVLGVNILHKENAVGKCYNL